MTTLMQRAADWMGTKLQDAAGRGVTLRRQSHVSSAITGTCTQQEYRYVGKDGAWTSAVLYDWVFTASEVLLDGDAITPRDGDRLIETLNGVEIEYEVLPVGKRQSCEWLDTSGVLLLVHTKRVN